MKKRWSYLEQLEQRELLTVNVELIADIHPGQAGSGALDDWFSVLDDELFFTAIDGSSGRELWKTDGTTEGTQLVDDIFAGSDGSFPRWMTPYEGELFFSARTAGQGSELWKTDGTSRGTTRLTDLRPGSEDSTPFDLIVYNDELIFTAEGNNGAEMYKADGNGRIEEVVDIFEGATGSDPASDSGYFEFNGMLYFNAEGPDGVELYRSDGNSAELVFDADDGDDDSWPTRFTEFQGDLYFIADTPIRNVSDYNTFLYRVDGDTGEASLFFDKDIDFREGMLVVGDSMYFAANDDENGRELYVTDGTTEGTQLVRQIMPGGDGSNPRSFMELDGKLVFAAGQTFEFGTVRVLHNLWITDGTAFNTRQISEVFIDPDVPFVEYQDEVYFRGFSEDTGWELYRSDGLQSELVSDLNSGSGDSLAFPKLVFEDQLIYLADDGRQGMEVWVWDGETHSIAEVYLGPGSFTTTPSLVSFHQLGPDLIFAGESPFEGKELFALRGTEVVVDRLQGDANEDNVVDFLDFLALSTNFGKTDSVWADGDFDENGEVDFLDFLVLSTNFGTERT